MSIKITVWLTMMCTTAAGLLLACDSFRREEPRIGVEVARDGAGYKFLISNCRTDHELIIDSLEVYRSDGRKDQSSIVCKVVAERLGTMWLDMWKYGTAPSGFRIETCSALTPGNSYEVHIVGTFVGVRRFEVKDDGSVEAFEPFCE